MPTNNPRANRYWSITASELMQKQREEALVQKEKNEQARLAREEDARDRRETIKRACHAELRRQEEEEMTRTAKWSGFAAENAARIGEPETIIPTMSTGSAIAGLAAEAARRPHPMASGGWHPPVEAPGPEPTYDIRPKVGRIPRVPVPQPEPPGPDTPPFEWPVLGRTPPQIEWPRPNPRTMQRPPAPVEAPYGRHVGYGTAAQISFAKDDDQAYRHLARIIYGDPDAADRILYERRHDLPHRSQRPGLLGFAPGTQGQVGRKYWQHPKRRLRHWRGRSWSGRRHPGWPSRNGRGGVAGTMMGTAFCEAMRQRAGDIMLRDPNVPQRPAILDPEDPRRFEPIWDSPLDYDEIAWQSLLNGGLAALTPAGRGARALMQLLRMQGGGQLPPSRPRPAPRVGRPRKATRRPR